MGNPKRFQYLRPASLNEALGLLSKYNGRARALMGGTDLMVRLQKGQIKVRDPPDAEEWNVIWYRYTQRESMSGR